MKRFLFIQIIVIAIAGCSSKPTRNGYLATLDRQIQCYPDSLIPVFDKSNRMIFLSPADRAYYDLLTSEYELNHLALIYQDTLINSSLDFFRNHHKGNEQLLSRTYLARARNRIAYANFTGALHDLLMARKWYGDDGKLAYQYRLDDVQGIINQKAGCYKIAQNFFRKAFGEATKMKDRNKMVESGNNLAISFEKGGYRDSFTSYIRKIRPLLPKADKRYVVNVMTNLGDLYLKVHQENKAYDYLQKAYPFDLTRKASLLLGNYYWYKKEKGKAVDLWYDACNSEDQTVRVTALDFLHRVLPYDDYVTELLVKTYKEIPKTETAETMAYIQQQYDKDIQQRRNYLAAITMLSVIIILLLVLVLFVVFHHRKIQRYRNKIQVINARYLEDIETYNRTKTDYRQAQVDIDQLQKRIADYQEDQKRPENWDMEALLLGAEAVLHLHRMASRGEKARQEEWQELYLLLSEKDARIVKFLSQHHELKAQEQYICMLIRMRFLPSEIAVLLDVSSQTVTNLRIRMMRKLFEVKGGAKEFDVQIRAI